MIYRFTTPSHTIETDMDLTGATVFVTYRQRDRIVCEKTGNALEVSADKIVIRLTQRDTGAFREDGGPVRIQVRYVFPDGSAGASNIMEAEVGGVLKGGVIEYAGEI